MYLMLSPCPPFQFTYLKASEFYPNSLNLLWSGPLVRQQCLTYLIGQEHYSELTKAFGVHYLKRISSSDFAERTQSDPLSENRLRSRCILIWHILLMHNSVTDKQTIIFNIRVLVDETIVEYPIKSLKNNRPTKLLKSPCQYFEHCALQKFLRFYPITRKGPWNFIEKLNI